MTGLYITLLTIFILIPLIILKWLRWHFISRRFTSIRAKQSFVLYLAFLPMSFHPFLYPLELFKSNFLKKVPQIWLWEKLNEIVSLYIILSFSSIQRISLGFAVLALLNLCVFSINKSKANFKLNIFFGAFLLTAQSIVISFLFSIILYDVFLVISISAAVSLITVVTKYTYFKKSLFKGEQTHFNDIADIYEDEIKINIRNKLLQKKIALMKEYANPEKQKKGLDVGCGQGWYAIEMAKENFEMSAIDPSEKQIEKSKKNLKDKSINIEFATAGAEKLPFPDSSFDFAYSINVFHHILNEEEREKSFKEILRVLKPSGIFFFHEVNINNPLFRFYLCYILPLVKNIDEGNERFILPTELPYVEGGAWEKHRDYFTFMPDFMPENLMNLFEPLEKYLERSRFKSWSAHYIARLIKDAA